MGKRHSSGSLLNTLVKWPGCEVIGCEAGTLRRWSLRRWTDRGIVVAYNKEAAEHRFFDRWSGESLPSYALTEPPEPPQARRVPTSDHDVIGLFPEPQSRT